MIISTSVLILLTINGMNPVRSLPFNRISDFSELPQCSGALVVANELQIVSDLGNQETRTDDSLVFAEQTHFGLKSSIQITAISLKQTYCMLMTSNHTHEHEEKSQIASSVTTPNWDKKGSNRVVQMVHIIDYQSLEHHYPISNVYQFGIPEITQNCKCDCAGGDTSCTIPAYNYRNCSTGALCYRTYNSGQQNTGCTTTGKTDLCCEIILNPYKDWIFQAIRLRQPTTIVKLNYRIFERSGRKWIKTVDQHVDVELNKGSTNFELNVLNSDLSSEHKIEITAIGGRPHRQVSEGLYFFKMVGDGLDFWSAGDRLRTAAINDQNEGSLEKLGWFRWDKGTGWSVRKGLEKVRSAQHVTVEDCKGQRYSSTFDAEQLVLKGSGENNDGLNNFDLGSFVKNEPWVEKVEVRERFVRINHAEGTALTLFIRTDSKPQILHRISHFSNFSGTIQLDKESNIYLNLTFQDAQGTLIGQVYSSHDSLSNMDVVFSVEVPKTRQTEVRTIVAMPSSINEPKLVCVYPSGDLEGKICHRLGYVWERIKEYQTMYSMWQQGHTECVGCNERGIEGFIANMDPRNWLDGINTPMELFTCILEILICAGSLLISIIVFSKCIWPLLKCVYRIARPPKKKGQQY